MLRIKMTEKLKPCPFCSEKELFIYEGVLYSYVKCQTCGTEGPSKYNEATEKAIKSWNTRPGPCEPSHGQPENWDELDAITRE